MMRAVAIALCTAGCSLLWLSGPICAQSILVDVSAAESRNPLPGAFVSLLNQEGGVLRSALTDAAGRALLSTTRAGRFQVKVEFLGRETQVSAAFELHAGESRRVPVSVPVQAIRLGEIRVDPDARCRLRPAEALEISQVWEAARNALAVQAWTEQTGLYRLLIATYDRDLDGVGRKVERENRRAATTLTRTPFASLPPEELIRSGFVQSLEGGGHQYYAPDAALLLSDLFLATHCFRLARSRDVPGAIGLAFEPVRTGEVSDIQGTLWLDEATAHLRFLEFRYTRTPYEEARGVAGGRVEFAAMPDGAWIIERWWIRAPILVRHANLARGGDSGIRVAGIRETGGEVVDATTRSQAQTRGSISGMVWDSTRAGPLVGATVSLQGTAYSAETDRGGRFVITGVPPGVFTAVLAHPRLDSLGIAAPAAEAEIMGGKATELTLAIPSEATILLAACSAEQVERPGAALSGTVRDRTRGAPIPGATVRVEWQEVERTRPIVQARDRWFEVRTDEEGRYTACGIPVNESVRVRASFLTYRGEVGEVGFPTAGHHVLNLEVPLPAGVVMARGLETGAQGIQGTVIDRETGSRVQGAGITILSVSGEVVASAVTNDRGLFRMTTPTPGRYLVSARVLGYGQLTGEAVEVSLGQLSVLEIRMAPEALALDPLVVAAESRAFHLEMEGFYRRKEEGLGVFMPPELLERRRPDKITNLLFGVPGVRVIEPAGGGRGRAIMFSSTLSCWPMIYVDRHLVSTGGLITAGAEPTAIDDVVFAADVMAVEVYRTPAEIPSEFNGPNAGCGVVVLWTRRGGSE